MALTITVAALTIDFDKILILFIFISFRNLIKLSNESQFNLVSLFIFKKVAKVKSFLVNCKYECDDSLIVHSGNVEVFYLEILTKLNQF